MRSTRIRKTRTWLTLLATAAAGVATAQGPSAPSIMAVMHKQFTTSRAPFKVVKKEMDAASPDWGAVREASDKFAGLAEALTKNTPLRGGPESWRELAARHVADAEALRAAAGARDLARLREVHKRIAESCNACHEVHRSRRDG